MYRYALIINSIRQLPFSLDFLKVAELRLKVGIELLTHLVILGWNECIENRENGKTLIDA